MFIVFYDVFVELCDKKGVSPSRAALSNGISKTSVTRWKCGAKPNPDILKKLSAYFNVSTDYLLGNKQKNKPPALLDDLNETELELIKKLREGPADVTAAVYRAAGVNYPDKK